MYSLTPVLYSVPYLALPEVGVNLLEDGNAEGGRLAGTRLSLGDHVHTLTQHNIRYSISIMCKSLILSTQFKSGSKILLS